MRPLAIGALFALGSVLAFAASAYVMFHVNSTDKLWQALSLVAVAMALRAVWQWWRVDRQLAIALVIALALPAMGVAALRNATPDPSAASWSQRDPDALASLRTRGFVFIAIGGAAVMWAGFRIRRVRRANPPRHP